MRHPILSGAGRLYFSVWFIIIILHGLALFFYYDYSLPIAIADSLVSNLLFAIISPGFWYVVKFASVNNDELAIVGTHLATAVISVLSWLLTSTFLLELIFKSNTEYINFLNQTYLGRGIIGTMYFSISVLIFYLIKYYQDMQERLGNELELQNLLKDTELRMLKSQINPHFIFNSLNSISSLTMSSPEDAQEMVIKLSNFLRYSLGKGNAEMNSLKQEIDNISLYLEIEKVRFGTRLQFEKNVSDECLEVKVPNLILQPLFENAIKYGVYDNLKPVTIELTCDPEPSFLKVSVLNDFDKDAVASKGEGIGLENVKKRLSLVYGRSDLLSTSKDQEKFCATIKIPTNLDSNE